ncbi:MULTISPECIES: cupin domain-containing protein [unclassified Sphingomonas]|uniref:cupin domain-containing protein n=1 Tax=unclassified Sphingomonas TaxID=196159 RepID=UPI0006FC310F|nr:MULTISPECIES: cupin domain-containing protein [unclassified Sphingomonas]
MAKMTFFRASSNADPGDDMMTIVGMEELDDAQRALLANDAKGAGVVQCLFRDPDPQGFSMVRAWAKSGFMLPRHSHSADCLYYVLAGEMHMGSVVLRAGDGVYVPRDNVYTFTAGPEGMEMLEFRNAASFDMRLRDNDAAHWGRIMESAERHRARWPDELPPSLRG